MKVKSSVDYARLNEVSTVMRALSHQLRLRIIAFIDKQRVTNVNQIYSSIKIEQSITSQQLKILRDAGLVNAKRDGKFIYYSLNYDKLNNISKMLLKYQKKI
jgi:ArsR family transcriptional regulator